MKAALTFLLLTVCVTLFAENVSIKPVGEGTAESPYLFDCLENFFWLRDATKDMDPNIPVYCKQIQDIDASATQQGGDYAWSDINFFKNNLFVYDGQGYNIEGLEPDKNGALFGTGYMQLKNIRIKGAEGIKTCALTKTLNSADGKNTLLENCHIKGLLGGAPALATYLSGKNITINGCIVEAEIDGLKNSGTLVHVFRVSGNCSIKNTCFKGKIKIDPSSLIGGMINYFRGVKNAVVSIEDCFVDMEIESKAEDWYKVGGLIETVAMDFDIDTNITLNIERCYVSGQADQYMAYGKAFFYNVSNKSNTLNVKDCYYNETLNLTDKYGTLKTDEEMKKQSTFKNWDFNNVWEIKEGESLPKLRAEKEYPGVNIKYKGKGSCAKINDVITIEDGSEKDSLIISALPDTPCQVKKILAPNGLKKLRVDGDLEELLIEGPTGSIRINGGDLGKEGDGYAVIFNGDKTKVQVKTAKNKATKELQGGNVRGNLLCGTQNEEGEITSYGQIKKFNVLGGNLENGKLTTGKLEGFKVKAKNGKGGEIINFEIEEKQ
jgi:hypothetical protein